MADLGSRVSDESDYKEHEIRTGHIHEADEEEEYGEEEMDQAEDEPDYEYPGEDTGRESDGGISFEKMKEIIMALQVALKKKDIELLQSKQQNIEILTELEKVSEQYIKDQTREADQLSRVKQYEEEFMEIQKGSIH